MQHASAPQAVTWAMIALCLAGAAAALLRLLAARPGPAQAQQVRYAGQGSELFHLVMLVAMALMWSPAADIGSLTGWRALFGALAAAALGRLGYTLVRGEPHTRGDEAGAAVYHCLSALAMLYATAGGAHSDTGSTGDHHDAHTGNPSHLPDAVEQLPFPVLGWLLAALFTLDALVVVFVTVRPQPEGGPGRRTMAVAVFAHLAMDVAMATMLVAAL